MKGGRKDGHAGIGGGGGGGAVGFWPLSPGELARFIFSVQGPGTAA